MRTAAQVAGMLLVSPRTVRDWCAAGQLPVYRIGREHRIDRLELSAWLAAHRTS